MCFVCFTQGAAWGININALYCYCVRVAHEYSSESKLSYEIHEKGGFYRVVAGESDEALSFCITAVVWLFSFCLSKEVEEENSLRFLFALVVHRV